MVKGIINSSMFRNVAIGATMLASVATAGQAAKPVTNPQTESSSQEQVMSPEASQALLAIVMSQSPSNTRNRAIENKFLAVAKPNQLGMENRAGIEAFYEACGGPYTIMNLQSGICELYFDKALDAFHRKESADIRERVEEHPTKEESEEYLMAMATGGTFGSGIGIGDYFCEGLDGTVENFGKFYHNNWVPYRDQFFARALQADGGKPSAKTCSETVDRLVDALVPSFLNENERREYRQNVSAFESTLSSSEVDQTNLIAYKVFTLDKLVFKALLRGDYSYITRDYRNWNSVFNRTFDGAKPQKETTTPTTPAFSLS